MRHPDVVKTDISSMIQMIDTQMAYLAADAARQGMNPAEMQDVSGHYLVVPLLTARAQVVLAEVLMEKG